MPWLDYGDPRLRDEVWERIYPEANTGCWLWSGWMHDKGYGRLQLAGRRRRIHQVTLELALGRLLAPGMEPDHLCRQRMCCWPVHLEEVTHAVNVRRSRHWNRVKAACGRAGHPFDEANTYRTPDGRRNCRACRSAATIAEGGR
jgi:hypothetical protein